MQSNMGEGMISGLQVELRGLIGSPELNGFRGLLQAWDSQDERWKVLLEDGIGKMLKPSNLVAVENCLKPGRKVYICGKPHVIITVLNRFSVTIFSWYRFDFHNYVVRIYAY